MINKIDQTQKALEINRQIRLQNIEMVSQQPLPQSSRLPKLSVVSNNVEILKDEDERQALDGHCREVEGKVTLILRIGEEERRVVVRMPRVVMEILVHCRVVILGNYWQFFLLVGVPTVLSCLMVKN